MEEAEAEWRKDPEWVAQQEARKKQEEERQKFLAADQAPLVKNLLNAGLEVESVYDLVNTRASYPEAIPVLLRHLGRPYHKITYEGIVRALIVKEAIGIATLPLMEEFKKTPPDRPGPAGGTKWLLA